MTKIKLSETARSVLVILARYKSEKLASQIKFGKMKPQKYGPSLKALEARGYAVSTATKEGVKWQITESGRDALKRTR